MESFEILGVPHAMTDSIYPNLTRHPMPCPHTSKQRIRSVCLRRMTRWRSYRFLQDIVRCKYLIESRTIYSTGTIDYWLAFAYVTDDRGRYHLGICLPILLWSEIKSMQTKATPQHSLFLVKAFIA